MLEDQIYAWQWTNRIRIANKAQKIMDANDIAPKVLPPGFLVPLLEAAGNVEDDTLQEMWAQLLVSGVEDQSNQHPAFITLLKEFGSDEALIFQNMKFNPSKQLHHSRIYSPEVASIQLKLSDVLKIKDDDFSYLTHRENIVSSIDHLEQMGLIRGDYDSFTDLSFVSIRARIVITPWGEKFANACLPPTPQ